LIFAFWFIGKRHLQFATFQQRLDNGVHRVKP
jgi:hypothetical protein